jgi:hypothetical protein
MKDGSSDIFQTTMVGLETGLQVLHITTFGPQSCASNENVSTVLSNPDVKEFDQIPVRRGGRVVGVIERASCLSSGLAEECMRTLDDAMLVSAQTPLTQFIPLLVETPYRLVLGGKEDHGINGIVTRSDLLKLPVRLFAFSLVTHLELLMSEIIHVQFVDKEDWWWAILSPQRRIKIEEKMDYLKQRNVNPPLLELTEFSDKRTILKKHLGLDKRFANDLEEIEDLRNKVAHAGNYAGSEAEILQFIARLRSAQHWIEHLTANYVKQAE